MTFALEVGDRDRTVEVRRHAGHYTVIVDGRVRLVQAAQVGSDGWSLLVQDGDGGSMRSIEAVVVPQNGGGSLDVYIDGLRIPVNQRTGLGRRSRGAAGAQGAGPQRLIAPMPGKVIRVLVAPGDEVQPRQGLVVVEAMKMENELRALRSGRVREILVREGQSVEAGAALVIVE